MALQCSKHVWRLSRSLFTKPLYSKPPDGSGIIHTTLVRTLFSEPDLGLDSHRRHSEILKNRLGDYKEKFRLRMEEHMQMSEKNTIFTDDLKTIIYTAESEEDLETATSMIRRFNQQNRELRFSHFMFGPIVMRMFYILNKPDEAYEMFADKEMDNMFNQVSSVTVVMDLQYKAEHYQRVLEIYDLVKRILYTKTGVPSNCVTLAVAACCKLNTPESMETMLKIFEDCKGDSRNMSARSSSLGALLALQQKKPETAIEILSLRNTENLMPPWPLADLNIKVLAYIQLERLGEAIDIIEVQHAEFNRQKAGDSVKHIMFSSVFDELKAAVESSGDEHLKSRFQSIEEKLAQSGRIRDLDIMEYVFRPLLKPRKFHNSYKSAKRGGLRRVTARGEYYEGLYNEEQS